MIKKNVIRESFDERIRELRERLQYLCDDRSRELSDDISERIRYMDEERGVRDEFSGLVCAYEDGWAQGLKVGRLETRLITLGLACKIEREIDLQLRALSSQQHDSLALVLTEFSSIEELRAWLENTLKTTTDNIISHNENTISGLRKTLEEYEFEQLKIRLLMDEECETLHPDLNTEKQKTLSPRQQYMARIQTIVDCHDRQTAAREAGFEDGLKHGFVESLDELRRCLHSR